jgi:RND family efflux transporter MFP subunit
MRRFFHLLLLALSLSALACGSGLNDPEEPALAVTVLTMTRQPFQPHLELVGIITPSASADLLAPAGGIVGYPARFPHGLVTGAPVKANEPLLTISSLERRRELTLARVSSEGASEELNRIERAFNLGVTPQVEVARARAASQLAQARLSSAEHEDAALVVRASVSGRLLIASAVPAGSEVRQGDLLGHIAGAGPLRVEAQAAASELNRLQAGQQVSFLAPGTSTVVGSGVLRAVAPVVDAAGAVTVVAEVTTATAMPPPGDGVDLRVALERRASALLVPEEAVLPSAAGSSVFLLARRGGGILRARRHAVRVGDHGDGWVEVLDGLAPGDRVATGGVSALVDGSAVIAIPARAESKQ